MWMIFASSSLSMIGNGRISWRQLVRAGFEQVRLGADGRADRGDHFFADGVERRVRDLGEQLLEVVEQQPRPLGQHGERRVGAHRPERLHTVQRHRRDEDLQLLVGVAEHLLAAQHAVVAEHDVLPAGQVAQVDDSSFQPLPVRELRGEGRLDLVVADHAALARVDEEHLAGLQTALGDHSRRLDVDHAHLGGHHDQVVVGDPVATRPQAVAVEHRADHFPVGEGDARRTVPGLHHRGVEPVEVALLLRHRGVVLPRLRDHHQHGVMDGVAAEVQQLEHLVEPRRVGGARRADRVAVLEPGEQVAGEHRFAGAHPVLVALDGVDLAVVGDEPVRVRERPRRERVRREPGVDDEQCGLDAIVGQIAEEGAQLRRREHPLVDDRAGRQRREVGVEFLRQLATQALARHVRLAIEFDPARAAGVADEQLHEPRHGGERRGAEARGVRREFPPTQDLEAAVGHRGLDHGDRLVEGDLVGGQEPDAGGVVTGGREIELDDGAIERVRDLQEDAGAVAGVGLRTGRTAVLQVRQRREAGANQFVGSNTVQVGDEGDAARVVLVSGVVEADLARGRAHDHIHQCRVWERSPAVPFRHRRR